MADIRWWKHRIVPGHQGGKYEKGNVLKCNTAMHAFMHEQLYRDYGDEYDRIAAAGLRGAVGKDEIIRAVQQETGRRVGKANKGKTVGVGLSNNKAKLANIYKYRTDELVAENVCIQEWLRHNDLVGNDLQRTARGHRKQAAGYYARYVEDL